MFSFVAKNEQQPNEKSYERILSELAFKNLIMLILRILTISKLISINNHSVNMMF